MTARRTTWLALLASAVLAVATPGCTYLGNRGRDAAEIVDLGVSVSAKPQFGLYLGLCPLPVGLGAGSVDGWYAGVGGGAVGLLEYHQRGRGRQIWGPETCEEAPKEPGKADSESKPAAPACLTLGCCGHSGGKPKCMHFFHIGWIGLTLNARPLEIPDFLLGWLGLDIMGDDARAAPCPKEASKEPVQEGHRERIGEPHGLP